jgi:Fe2+ or Zn2+ uptake regulation protein
MSDISKCPVMGHLAPPTRHTAAAAMNNGDWWPNQLNLNILTDKGIIRRIQPADSAALYEDRIGDNHHHLVCRSCGKTEDVCCAVGDAPCLTAHSHHGFKIDEAEVIYWGTCPACQQKPRD